MNLKKVAEMVRHIFVYGTLKEGHRNHAILRQLAAHFVCKASVMKMVLVDTHGKYPYMVQATDWQHTAVGELWAVPDGVTTKLLDKIEIPAGYIPIKIDVNSEDVNGMYYQDVISYLYPGVYYDGMCVRQINNEDRVTIKTVHDGVPWGTNKETKEERLTKVKNTAYAMINGENKE